MKQVIVPDTEPLSIQAMQHLHTRKWYAWIDLLQPNPKKILLRGEIEAQNPGLKSLLVKKKTNKAANILSLELILSQAAGNWPELDCWIPATYHEILLGDIFQTVEIFLVDRLIERFPVDLMSG